MDYSKMETVVGKQFDERLPFNCFQVDKDWDKVREWLSKHHKLLKKLNVGEEVNIPRSFVNDAEQK